MRPALEVGVRVDEHERQAVGAQELARCLGHPAVDEEAVARIIAREQALQVRFGDDVEHGPLLLGGLDHAAHVAARVRCEVQPRVDVALGRDQTDRHRLMRAADDRAAAGDLLDQVAVGQLVERADRGDAADTELLAHAGDRVEVVAVGMRRQLGAQRVVNQPPPRRRGLARRAALAFARGVRSHAACSAACSSIAPPLTPVSPADPCNVYISRPRAKRKYIERPATCEQETPLTSPERGFGPDSSAPMGLCPAGDGARPAWGGGPR